MDEEKDGDKIKIVLNSNEGAIVFLEGDNSEYFVAPLDDEPRSKDIRASIAFFVYAIQKEEWVEEFNKYMVEFYEEEMKQLKKSHLKIIK